MNGCCFLFFSFFCNNKWMLLTLVPYAFTTSMLVWMYFSSLSFGWWREGCGRCKIASYHSICLLLGWFWTSRCMSIDCSSDRMPRIKWSFQVVTLILLHWIYSTSGMCSLSVSRWGSWILSPRTKTIFITSLVIDRWVIGDYWQGTH